MTTPTTTRTITFGDGSTIRLVLPTTLPTDARAEELRAVFARLHNPTDWKAPIRRTVTVERFADLDTIAEAIEFMTATTATITPEPGLGPMTFAITADGYRLGPAN